MGAREVKKERHDETYEPRNRERRRGIQGERERGKTYVGREVRETQEDRERGERQGKGDERDREGKETGRGERERG